MYSARQMEEWQRLKIPVFPLGPFPSDVAALLENHAASFITAPQLVILDDIEEWFFHHMARMIIEERFVPFLNVNPKLRRHLLHFFIGWNDLVNCPGFIMNQNEPNLLPLMEQCFSKLDQWQDWQIRYPD